MCVVYHEQAVAQVRVKGDAAMDDYMSRISGFAIEADVVDTAQLSAVPGLIEARRIGERYQLSIADADEETRVELERISANSIEEIDPTFADSVLAYLAGHRRESSFLSSERTGAI